MMTFFTTLLAGLLSNNCLVANCSAVDVATSGGKSLKNISIYSLIVFAVSLLSAVTLQICKPLFVYFGLQSAVYIAIAFVVAIYVQIAEFVVKRTCPVLFKQMKYFVPVLACVLMLFMIGSMATLKSFGIVLLAVVGESLGLWLVLAITVGLKRNFDKPSLKDNYRGMVLSLVIVFVLMVIWTVF